MRALSAARGLAGTIAPVQCPPSSSLRWALWVFAAALLLKAAMPMLASASAQAQGKAVVESARSTASRWARSTGMTRWRSIRRPQPTIWPITATSTAR